MFKQLSYYNSLSSKEIDTENPFSIILTVHNTELRIISFMPSSTARAQSIDEALRLYKGGDYKDAALLFYDVLTNEVNPDTRDQAQIYLAETLRKMQLWVPAMFGKLEKKY